MRVIHFHNGKGGGVLSVIKNLLQYSENRVIENHVIYTVNTNEQHRFQLPQLKGAVSEKLFTYNTNWNFYYTCKQLAKLVEDENTILVAHDWLELGMVQQLGLRNPVIQFVHGDYPYYYQLAKRHEKVVNAFVCVSASICNQLQLLIPHRKEEIAYLRLPVPPINTKQDNKKGNQVVFIGRCEEGKGYHLLPSIAAQLAAAGTDFEWTIYGEGSLDEARQKNWPVNITVQFKGVIAGNELLQQLPVYDYLVLPTIAEGMPVTIIEAMKAGVLPIVNNLPGGVQELIGKNERGILVEENKADGYVKALQQLQANPEKAKAITEAAMLYANDTFDAVGCTKAIEDFFTKFAYIRPGVIAKKKYGSRLDQKWLPNMLVEVIRKYFLPKQHQQKSK